jgi:hypothetical protein
MTIIATIEPKKGIGSRRQSLNARFVGRLDIAKTIVQYM